MPGLWCLKTICDCTVDLDNDYTDIWAWWLGYCLNTISSCTTGLVYSTCKKDSAGIGSCSVFRSFNVLASINYSLSTLVSSGVTFTIRTIKGFGCSISSSTLLYASSFFSSYLTQWFIKQANQREQADATTIQIGRLFLPSSLIFSATAYFFLSSSFFFVNSAFVTLSFTNYSW